MKKAKFSFVLIFSIISQFACSLAAPSKSNMPETDVSETVSDVVETPSFDLELEKISLSNIQDITLVAEIFQANDVTIDNFYKGIESVDVSLSGEKIVFATQKSGYLIDLSNGKSWQLSHSKDDVNFVSNGDFILSLPNADLYSSCQPPILYTRDK